MISYKNMNDRFWAFYYWAMIAYLGIALITLVDAKQKEMVHPYSQTCEEIKEDLVKTNKERKKRGEGPLVSLRLDNCEPTEVNKLPNPYLLTFEQTIFFDFIDNYDDSFSDRYITNYYPFLLFFLLTFTRWIVIGKHFWQRP